MTFGLAVFGTTLSWLLVVTLFVPLLRLYQIVTQSNTLEWTDVLLPLAYFVQFLFSQSTVIWYLAASVTWSLAVLQPSCRAVLLGFYRTREQEGHTPPPSFIKVWNVFGYLMFLLSLLFQSD